MKAMLLLINPIIIFLIPPILLAGETKTTATAKDLKALGSQKITKIQDINRNPAKWIGKRVTIRGAVVSSTIDTLVLDGSGVFNDRILVINQAQKGEPRKADIGTEKGEAAAAIATNSLLSVNGEVRRLKLSEIREVYLVHPAREILSEFNTSMPVLVVNFSDLSGTEKP